MEAAGEQKAISCCLFHIRLLKLGQCRKVIWGFAILSGLFEVHYLGEMLALAKASSKTVDL